MKGEEVKEQGLGKHHPDYHHLHAHHNAQWPQTMVELLSNRMGALQTSVIPENKGMGEPWQNKTLSSRNHTNVWNGMLGKEPSAILSPAEFPELGNQPQNARRRRHAAFSLLI